MAARVESTGFSFYTAAELRALSVCEIISPISFDALNQPVPRGLFDPSLGAWDRNMRCPTCGETDRYCPGHVGHVELAVPCFQPLLFGTVHKVLGVKCFHCHHLLLDDLRVKYFQARLALIEAGEWALAETLPEAPKATGLRPTEADVSAHENRRRACREGLDAALALTEGRDAAIGEHARVERVAATKAFWQALKDPRRCENCGAARRKVRKDGATKLFSMPLDKYAARADAAAGISAPSSARKEKTKKKKRAGSGEDSSEDSFVESDDSSEDDEDAAGRALALAAEKYLDPVEVREQLRLLWSHAGAALEALLGRIGTSHELSSSSSSSPHFFTLEVLGVPAPRFRPAQTVGAVLAEHPQNSSLSKVLQLNDKIRTLGEAEAGAAAGKREALVQLWLELQEEVNVYIDSSKSSSPSQQAPGIKQLLERKEGMFRKHMMGKRVDFCCRSVISPDPFVGSGEVGMPLKFATGLSYPEAVTAHNVEQLRAMVENGAEEWPGANYVELKGSRGSRIDLSRVTSRARRSALAKQLLTTPGQRVGRHVLDGDMVLLNRQPTLHKPGIMAHSVKVLAADELKDHQTFRMHYANCNAYNADFDGDEINCHMPQSELARAEAAVITTTHEQYIVPTDGSPLRGLIQDHVDAAVKLSMRDCFFTREVYFQFLFDACRVAVGSDATAVIDPYAAGPPAILAPCALYTGRQLLSCVLAHVTRRFGPRAKRAPLLAAFEAKSKVAAKAVGGEALDEHLFEVRRGQILKGVFDKAQFGSNGLVHAVYELYGSSAAGCLLDTLARFFTVFIRDYAGHTCGIGDMVLTQGADARRQALVVAAHQTGVDALDDFLNKRFAVHDDGAPAAAATKENNDPLLFETAESRRKRRTAATVRAAAGGAQLDGAMAAAMAPAHSAIVKACLPDGLRTPFPLNNFSLMVTTGAKGSVVNQSQITCALGQQSLEGRRVPLMANGKSLPSFEAYDPSPRAGGFITDRFLTGIRPQEYYFHCMAGREGLVDTAVKTSRSGYLQRCLVKHLEEYSVAYDYTVRDAQGGVVQFLYGEASDAPRDPREAPSAQVVQAWKDLRASGPEGAVVIRAGAFVDARRRRRVGGGAEEEDSSRKVRPPTGRRDLARAWSSARVLKTHKDGTVDLVFLADGAVVKKVPRAVEGVAVVRSSPAPDREPLNSRYHPSEIGAVSDKVAEALDADDADDDDDELSFRNAVYAKYARSLAAPGEAVGALAAQSVGEPSTQMTLNTFHLAGHGAGNVTLGIPRLREIIMTASTAIKTPLVVLPFHKGLVVVPGNNNHQRAEQLAKALSKVTLMDLVDSRVDATVAEAVEKDGEALRRVYKARIRLHATANIEAAFGGDLLDDEVLAASLELKLAPALRKLNVVKPPTEVAAPSAAVPQKKKPSKAPKGDDDDDVDSSGDEDDADDADNAEQGTLSFARRKEVAGYDDDDEDEDENEDDVVAEKGDSSEVEEEDVVKAAPAPFQKKSRPKASKGRKQLSVRVACSTEASASSGGFCRKVLDVDISVPAAWVRTDVASLVERALAATVVRQAKSVTRAVVDPKRVVDGAERGGLLIEGRDFEAVWKAALPFADVVDVNAFESNDISGFLTHYGVEAARISIVREIRGVFGVYGITVDPRHLSLIADSMTFAGGYKAMNRSSMGLTSSPYLQMSFETTAQFLTTAALAHARDALQSPSAKIVLGQLAKVGTNVFDVVVPLTPHHR